MNFVAEKEATAPVPDHLLIKNQLNSPENVQLFESALVGSVAGVQAALAKGGKPNYFHRPEDQKNSLHVASEGGHGEIVQMLLSHDANVDCIVATSQATALILAAQNNNPKVIEILIAHKANVNAVNCYGNTALHEAAQGGFEEVVDVLLKNKANANAVNHKGSSPLHFACYGSDKKQHPVSVVQKLINAGADVNTKDQRGMTPFLVCCTSGRQDIIDGLLKAGADTHAKDNERRGGYDIAIFYQHTKLAAQLGGPDSPAKRFHMDKL